MVLWTSSLSKQLIVPLEPSLQYSLNIAFWFDTFAVNNCKNAPVSFAMSACSSAYNNSRNAEWVPIKFDNDGILRKHVGAFKFWLKSGIYEYGHFARKSRPTCAYPLLSSLTRSERKMPRKKLVELYRTHALCSLHFPECFTVFVITKQEREN
jgi:hypothetical protein